MKDPHDRTVHEHRRHSTEPALHVICIASGGGPSESDVTGFLVRSISRKWAKNSVLALDAGAHLSGIVRILEKDFPLISNYQEPQPDATTGTYSRASNWSRVSLLRDDTEGSEVASLSSRSTSPERELTVVTSGPFSGFSFPYDSARANAAHLMRENISTYLITHAHLDHISAFAINTAAFHNTARPKRLAALPSTVNAIKAHIFNDIIWPNLTDEDGGVGLVTFQRLADGGNIAVGEGRGKGYIEVCDGLCVRGMKISHGTCLQVPTAVSARQREMGWTEATLSKSNGSQVREEDPNGRAMAAQQSQHAAATNSNASSTSRHLVVDSTAYFIRDDHSHREILFFGDVEPDTISHLPRNAHVWSEAAPKVASKKLKAVFIECSYDDSQDDSILFGHLCPRHLFRELEVLADKVKVVRADEHRRREHKKRKRAAISESPDSRQPPSWPQALGPPQSPATLHSPQLHGAGGTPADNAHGDKRRRTSVLSLDSVGQSAASDSSELIPGKAAEASTTPNEGPLHGLAVVIIHVKDTLRDGPLVGDNILQHLHAHEARLKELDGTGLGCDFIVSGAGESYYF